MNIQCDIIFFFTSQNMWKCKKCVAFLICGSHFLQFQKFLTENNTGNKFGIISILQFERDGKKRKKLDHRENYTIYNMHCPICKISWDDGGTPNFTENENLYNKYTNFHFACVSQCLLVNLNMFFSVCLQRLF